jgi:hypothetical protein
LPARLRVGRLCVAIQASSPAEMMERAEAALADSKFLEFRLDSLAKPAAALPKGEGIPGRASGRDRDCHLPAQAVWRQLRGPWRGV